MAKVLQHRRGTATEHSNFVGAEGEFTYDTSEKRIVAHDGVTKGGIPMAKKEEVEQVANSLDPRILDAASQSDILEAVSQATVGNVDAPTLEGLQAQIAANASNIASKPTPVRYVVEKWSSGTEWYTKYSDGWVEQGGVANGSNLSNVGGSITLYIAFSNDNYSAVFTPSNRSGGSLWGGYPPTKDRTSTSTTLKWGVYGGSGGEVYWEAKGY